tara:strand:+ start:582 stop:1571 length:990 start_codon:yes stop_codon:yes gene_type:complete
MTTTMLPASVAIITELVESNTHLNIIKKDLSEFLTSCRNGDTALPATLDFSIGSIYICFTVKNDSTPIIETTLKLSSSFSKLTLIQLKTLSKLLCGTSQQIVVNCSEKNNIWNRYIIHSTGYKIQKLKSVIIKTRVLKSSIERQKRMRQNPFGDVLKSGNRGASIVSKDSFKIISSTANDTKKNVSIKSKTKKKGRSLKDLTESSFFKGKGRSRNWGAATSSVDKPVNKKYVPPGRRLNNTTTKEAQCSIMLMNLPRDITRKDINQLFDPFGFIHNIHILYDRYDTTKAFKAFVNFALEEEARAAIAAKGTVKMSSRIIDIQMSKPKKK